MNRYQLPAVPLPLLLRHMEKFYTPYQLEHDVDCVEACCANEEDRAAVRRYAKALLRGGSPKAEGGRAAICQRCGNGFAPKRSTARYCSARCRVSASRRGACYANSGSGR